MKRFAIILLVLTLFVALILVVTGNFFARLNMINTPLARITEQPMSRSDFIADFGITNLPVSASNICYALASASMGFAGAKLYRFDAPSEDCVAYASELISRSNSNSDSDHQVPTELIAISAHPEPLRADMQRAYGFEKVDWFDVERVRNGLTGHGPHPVSPLFGSILIVTGSIITGQIKN